MNIETNYIEVVVSALIINKDNNILLTKSPKWSNKYLFPGGHVERSETLFDAVKREVKEETGLDVNPLHCINVGELIDSPDFYKKAHLIYFDIVCEALTEDITLDENELTEYVWLNPAETLSQNIGPGIKESIENYISGKKISTSS